MRVLFLVPMPIVVSKLSARNINKSAHWDPRRHWLDRYLLKTPELARYYLGNLVKYIELVAPELREVMCR
jgi:hypothetical protein